MGENSKRQGFGSMTPEKRRAIASAGGRAAFEKGVIHRFTSGEPAAEAGRKGGLARARNQAARKAAVR